MQVEKEKIKNSISAFEFVWTIIGSLILVVVGISLFLFALSI